MKLIAPFVFLFLSVFHLSADCGMGSITIFSSGKTLSQNSLIMLQGDWFYQKMANRVNSQYPIYLKSDKHIVYLKTIEVCETETGYTQVFLEPKIPLRIGDTYKLEIENLESEFQDWNNRSYNHNEGYNWRITNKISYEEPNFKTVPKLTERIYQMYGCGDESHAVFDFELTDSSEVLFLTELVNLENSESQMAYLPVRNMKIYVGHGMCGGAFWYERNTKYKVRFRIRNHAGNFSKDWTNWIEFESPNSSILSKINQKIRSFR